MLPTGIGRIGLGQPLDDCQSSLEGGEGCFNAALVHIHIPHPGMGHCEIMLPTGIGRIGLGQATTDRQGFHVRSKGNLQLTLTDANVSEKTVSLS